jgi:ABC-type enterobactin transport system permease subunit
MTELLVVLAIAAAATVGGVWFGIVVVAPRITRRLDRPESIEEEPGDRPD